ncbi:MAG TPA: pirin family protein [Mycobacteriales bacterium]|nr:pirin family protein [Mycobacteriales bacterium]
MGDVEVVESHEAQVGPLTVRRALPRRVHRTVGAWCFADHMGPAAIDPDTALIGPHPHIGLQTVTWLVEGELLHRDSLGSEQVLKPGELNLMTAGHGVAHAEESTGSYRGDLHALQLWVAQPSMTRDRPPAFEHHDDLPRATYGDADVTVLVGTLDGHSSSARHDSELLGAELALHSGTATVPLDTAFEHAVIALSGAVAVGDTVLTPGRWGFLAPGRDELAISAQGPSRAMLLGGVPFGEDIVMWWNFVGRTREEIAAADRAWMAQDERFGPVSSALPRIPSPQLPWLR